MNKYFRKFRKLGSWLTWNWPFIFVVILLISISAFVFWIVCNTPIKSDSSFKDLYCIKLKQYADKDKNGFITAAEQDEFDYNLLKDKNVTLRHARMPVDEIGNTVSFELLSKWLVEYKE